MIGTKISDLTVDEFRSLVRETVRQTLAELLSDPDEGLVLQDGVESALKHSIKAVKEGAPTYDAKEAAKRLGLEW
ncbi:MAG: hypothetical protein AB1846_04050 [Chloroflexota bacterium]